MNAYNVDFAKMTITITADFAKKMNDPTSREYQTISQFLKDFPTIMTTIGKLLFDYLNRKLKRSMPNVITTNRSKMAVKKVSIYNPRVRF